MKRSYLLAVAALMAVSVLAVPVAASAFQVTGGGGTQTQNAYGLWYAGQEACAQEGCHAAIAAKESPHGNMVTDVKMYPSKLVPAAGSAFWPYSSPFGGLILKPRDMYLQVGDGYGFLEYIAANPSALATNPVPADDLSVWDPMEYTFGENGSEGDWAAPKGPVGYGSYSQSCSACHNLGVTRPSDKTYTLVNGGTQSTSTPSGVSAFSIQCEVCHGSGKTPDGHKKGVPAVVGGRQMLKAQVCGQCHVSGTTPQKNAKGSAFGNPNGYTTDTTLSAYLTPYTTVESETTFMAYVNNPKWPGVVSGMTKPKFLPNGADFSMRHSYYNEWMVSGHAASPRSSTATSTSGPLCLKCHSGEGYLFRVGAKGADGKRLIATRPSTETALASDPGISCQVCHTGHIGYKPEGGYESIRVKPDGAEVACGDCHNWRYEMMEYPMQYETINGVEYTRPPLNQRPHIPQREIVEGGFGGEDGMAGMWGVAPMGKFMPGVTCQNCHMPRTHKEGMPADDDGTNEATRMSHRFKVVLPGDAARWKLRPNGESCTQRCHKKDAAEFTRAEFQTWIDETSATVVAASADVSATLGAIGAPLGFTRYRSFESAQPTTGPAAEISPARWTMLQHAAQNLNMVTGDGSKGLHNPAYVLAGLRKASLWANAASATIDATIGVGPVSGAGSTVSGTLLGFSGEAIPGAEVALQTSTDGDAWSVVSTTSPSASTGSFALPTGVVVGSRLYRVAFTPSAGVADYSAVIAVHVPVTTAAFLPVNAPDGWINASLVTVTLNATPGSLTFYTLSGATTAAQSIYTGPISVTAEGATTITYWSTDAEGTEGANTAVVRLDRAAPTVATDAVAEYLNSSTVRVWGTDTGAGISKLEYALDGGTMITAATTWVNVPTSKLGKHSLVVRVTDGAGKVTSRTIGYRVRTQPSLTRSPSGSSYTVGRGKSLALKGTLHSSSGAHISGKSVKLQRSTNGSSWSTYKTFTSNSSGVVSFTVKPSSKGTVYWRWYSAESDSYRAAASSKVRIATP